MREPPGWNCEALTRASYAVTPAHSSGAALSESASWKVKSLVHTPHLSMSLEFLLSIKGPRYNILKIHHTCQRSQYCSLFRRTDALHEHIRCSPLDRICHVLTVKNLFFSSETRQLTACISLNHETNSVPDFEPHHSRAKFWDNSNGYTSLVMHKIQKQRCYVYARGHHKREVWPEKVGLIPYRQQDRSCIVSK